MALLGLECQEAPEDRVEPDHMGRVPSRQGILGRTRGGLGFPQTPAVSKLHHGQNSLARKGTVTGGTRQRMGGGAPAMGWLWDENLGERPR